MTPDVTTINRYLHAQELVEELNLFLMTTTSDFLIQKNGEHLYQSSSITNVIAFLAGCSNPLIERN